MSRAMPLDVAWNSTRCTWSVTTVVVNEEPRGTLFAKDGVWQIGEQRDDRLCIHRIDWSRIRLS
jgi:hypothetical protein